MKLIKHFLIILIYFILQVGIISKISILDFRANLAPILIAFAAIYHKGEYKARYFGLAFGLLLDIFLNKKFGIYGASLFFTGILGEKISEYINSKSIISLIILTVSLTIIGNGMTGILFKIMGNNFSLIYIFKRMFTIEIIFNSLLAMLCYFINIKLGFWSNLRKDFNA